MSREDLHADLLADLAPPLVTAPLVAEPPPLPPEPPVDATPAVSVDVTPLRWSRPRVVRASDGAGKALRFGPVTIELTLREGS